MEDNKGGEYLIMKMVSQLEEFLGELEDDVMEREPDKKDLRITHQAYSAEFTLLIKDDVLQDKAGSFFVKGPQPGKRLIDTRIADLFRKYADLARAEGCDRLAALFEIHAIAYEAGFGSTLSYGIVEQMRQHFLPGDMPVFDN